VDQWAHLADDIVLEGDLVPGNEKEGGSSAHRFYIQGAEGTTADIQVGGYRIG
jgi:hypothetical protein